MKRFPLRAGLVLALLPALALAQAAIPEPDVGSLGASFLQALMSKNWGLLLSVALLAVVWAVRAFGGRLWAPIATPRGSALLSFFGGTLALLVAALGTGQSFSLSLLLSCVSTALTASGLWSTTKAVVERAKPQPMAPERCTPIQIANGTCTPG
jgi:hypothetical protein